ncbi:MAG TPA: methylmalonyl Co-A mutase-associated GTPase MeaB [Hyphomicrobiales bacterium]|nr:methylmalonyl Co-A mutase-associated GTPase MeaB [Hyphomicrobiales bacterium]
MHANQNYGSATSLSAETLAAQILDGRRAALARAITLVESSKPDHRDKANALLNSLYHATGKSCRIGVTGLPGVGKSTFIDQFGMNLLNEGHSVAVLAVDPSSRRTGGSILGDKTRMQMLAAQARAFIRPSPAGKTLGGVARATRETLLLCEAAGFDVVIVETVGVGQSESAVAGMVDFFLALLLPGAGDELQGLKKGLIELADMIAINKADGELERQAMATAADYNAALHILSRGSASWTPSAAAVSAKQNGGLTEIWSAIQQHRDALQQSGEFEAKRREQTVAWMHELIEQQLRQLVLGKPEMMEMISSAEDDVRKGAIAPGVAADRIVAQSGLA